MKGGETMSVESKYGKYYPTCNICGEELTPCNTFEEAVQAMKDANWGYSGTAHGPENYCTECKD
jgi:hypothetical protein